MPAIAALLLSRGAFIALRRTIPRGGPKVVSCRTAASLHRLLQTRLVDAIVLSPRESLLPELASLRARLPSLPVVAYAQFRPDDGDLLLACRRHNLAGVVVEGVDDAVAGDLVLRSSVTAERRRALLDGPRMLRLTEPLQQSAWNVLIGEVERPMRTSALAARLQISREHLSRQFGAGGAPNLKRVIDLTRVACAAQLLGNPGFAVQTVARVLHFTSPNHLSRTARRITNLPTSGLGRLGARGVLSAFVQGNTRSRG